MLPGYLIKNARILDPRRNIDQTGDLAIYGGKMTAVEEVPDIGALQSLDASDCLVTPGLVDFHCHLGQWLTDTGVNPDLMTLPNGITAAVDAGSTGTAGVEGFIRHVIANNETTIKLFVNVSAMGVATERHTENPDPSLFDEHALTRICEQYPELVLGLKIRLGRNFSDGWGTSSFMRAKEIALKIGKPICVHVIDPEFPYGQLLELMGEGDILCHCFQGRGNSILDANGKVNETVLRARERGVAFDAAVGRINYDLDVAAKALADGFFPDVISTDAVSTSVYQHKLFHLLYVMSIFLGLGMELSEVVRVCTATPASLMGLDGRIGTLAPGAWGDVAIFRIRDKAMRLNDQYGHSVETRHLLVPQATFKAGRLVYKQIDFEF